MEPILSRCGYRCDLCLAFYPNLTANPQTRRVFSDGWHRYCGFRIPPSQICCDGCMTDEPQLIDQSWPVRACVIEHGLDHCHQWAHFICEKLETRIVDDEDVCQRGERKVSDDDCQRFIRPDESCRRFEALRRSASGEEAQ